MFSNVVETGTTIDDKTKCKISSDEATQNLSELDSIINNDMQNETNRKVKTQPNLQNWSMPQQHISTVVGRQLYHIPREINGRIISEGTRNVT